jgi:hypothetical protein
MVSEPPLPPVAIAVLIGSILIAVAVALLPVNPGPPLLPVTMTILLWAAADKWRAASAARTSTMRGLPDRLNEEGEIPNDECFITSKH